MVLQGGGAKHRMVCWQNSPQPPLKKGNHRQTLGVSWVTVEGGPGNGTGKDGRGGGSTGGSEPEGQEMERKKKARTDWRPRVQLTGTTKRT